MQLIKKGKAYVCDLRPTRWSRRVPRHASEAGSDSPFRDRTVEENLDLFAAMRAGEFPDGAQDAAREDRHGVAATSTCATR